MQQTRFYNVRGAIIVEVITFLTQTPIMEVAKRNFLVKRLQPQAKTAAATGSKMALSQESLQLLVKILGERLESISQRGESNLTMQQHYESLTSLLRPQAQNAE